MHVHTSMVNPGAFRGKRKGFLMDKREGYGLAMQEDHAAEAVANITCRYLKRFPTSMSDNVEPSNEDLARIDDGAPDPEISPPSEDGVKASEYKQLKVLYDEDAKKLTFKKQVSRLRRSRT